MLLYQNITNVMYDAISEVFQMPVKPFKGQTIQIYTPFQVLRNGQSVPK